MKKSLYTLLTTALVALVLCSCRPPDVSNVFGMFERHGESMSQASQDFTPEQEFYLGRAVAARIVSRYGALEDPTANGYLNKVGQALAMRARHMQNGYHFLLLNSPEVNAFAAPGGFIFVTTGMMSLVSGESELAAVLAHEIAHVQNRDAIAAIQNARLTGALTALGKDASGQYTPAVPGSQYLGVFSGAVDDVISTLVTKGYSRGQEYAADAAAKGILSSAGYDPRALESVLQAMSKRVSPGSAGFGSTHPSAENRLDKLSASGTPFGKDTGVRASRFQAAMSKYSRAAQ